MEGTHHHHHHQQQQQHPLHQHPYSVGIDTSGAGADRFPQWSIQETRDFLVIRADFDPTFMETKRNKALWETIATKMKDKGYNRSAEQCKCKWKNLVTRYKACQTMETESMRQQFPFYNELQAIFTARMQRMLWMEAEGGTSGSKNKKGNNLSSDDEEDNEDMSDGEKGITSKKKRKIRGNVDTGGNNYFANLREVLDDFMKQQMQMEMKWLKTYEVREEEKKVKEMEWRQNMEAIEKDRLLMLRRFRQREEERSIREEARAEKRDALITALLIKLRREDI